MNSPVRHDLTGCPFHDRQEFFHQRLSAARTVASDVTVFTTGFTPGFRWLFRQPALFGSVSPGLHRNAGGTRWTAHRISLSQIAEQQGDTTCLNEKQKRRKARNHPLRRMTPGMFWKAVMIVTNHAYFNCRRRTTTVTHGSFRGCLHSGRLSIWSPSDVNHAICSKGWLDNDEKQR